MDWGFGLCAVQLGPYRSVIRYLRLATACTSVWSSPSAIYKEQRPWPANSVWIMRSDPLKEKGSWTAWICSRESNQDSDGSLGVIVISASISWPLVDNIGSSNGLIWSCQLHFASQSEPPCSLVLWHTASYACSIPWVWYRGIESDPVRKEGPVLWVSPLRRLQGRRSQTSDHQFWICLRRRRLSKSYRWLTLLISTFIDFHQLRLSHFHAETLIVPIRWW